MKPNEYQPANSVGAHFLGRSNQVWKRRGKGTREKGKAAGDTRMIEGRLDQNLDHYYRVIIINIDSLRLCG